MYIKIISNFILMLTLMITQVAFIGGLPGYLSNINFVLVIVILILGFISFEQALLWSLVVGLLWDTYTFSFFGVHTVCLLFALFVTSFLLENFLTNRSLYTFLALSIVGGIIFEIVFFLLHFILTLFTSATLQIHFLDGFWLDEFSKIITSTFLVLALFYIVSFFNKKFKPMFLIR